MNTFHLTIVTPDGEKFNGLVTDINFPATEGGVTVLARHENFVTTIGMGPASVGFEEGKKTAACIGGMFSVVKGEAKLIATSFEWAEDIDVERAEKALKRAEDKLAKADITPADKALATAAKHRAMVRLGCVNAKKN